MTIHKLSSEHCQESNLHNYAITFCWCRFQVIDILDPTIKYQTTTSYKNSPIFPYYILTLIGKQLHWSISICAYRCTVLKGIIYFWAVTNISNFFVAENRIIPLKIARITKIYQKNSGWLSSVYKTSILVIEGNRWYIYQIEVRNVPIKKKEHGTRKIKTISKIEIIFSVTYKNICHF